MMSPNAADNLCERVIDWGVTSIYGFLGVGINGMLGALRRREEQLAEPQLTS
ncbi:MAG TPA: hypothetical protein VIJ99_10925 [Acidimicrobiales bacterium]